MNRPALPGQPSGNMDDVGIAFRFFQDNRKFVAGMPCKMGLSRRD
ncbi:hypothetical protein [Undibacterium sp.]|nr:hypothetical protein [Undibacterium sp.]HTD03622.1 hypothetical protein [Undibacterium sp.]